MTGNQQQNQGSKVEQACADQCATPSDPVDALRGFVVLLARQAARDVVAGSMTDPDFDNSLDVEQLTKDRGGDV